MKDLENFTTACIAQYFLEVTKEKYKKGNTATSTTASLYNFQLKLLGEIMGQCDEHSEYLYHIKTFTEAISEINFGGTL